MKTIKDVKYANASEMQTMDIYIPDRAGNRTFPLIMYIHGGGFSAGDKSSGNHIPAQNNPNFVIANINYRLSGEAPFPAGLNDCETALKFLLNNSRKYHFNRKAAIMGGSAGGNFALMLGTNRDLMSQLDKVCIVAQYPVADMVWLGEYVKNLPDDDEVKTYSMSSSELYFNKQFDKITVEETEKASPLHHLTKDMPSTLIQHGTADDLVPLYQSKLFVDKAKRLEVDIKLEQFKGANHSHPDFKTAKNLQHIFDYISSKLN